MIEINVLNACACMGNFGWSDDGSCVCTWLRNPEKYPEQIAKNEKRSEEQMRVLASLFDGTHPIWKKETK